MNITTDPNEAIKIQREKSLEERHKSDDTSAFAHIARYNARRVFDETSKQAKATSKFFQVFLGAMK